MSTNGFDHGLLHALGEVYESLPYPVLLAGLSLFVASCFPHLKDRYLVSYWVTFIAGFGGGTTSALLLQDPAKAPIALLSSNLVGVTFTSCWWAVNFFPGNLVYRLHSLLPVKMATKVCLNILRAGLLASRIDVTVAKYPTVVIAPLLIGTIAGSGGRFISDMMQAGWGTLRAPTELSNPGYVSRSGFAGALLYWLTVHVLRTLSPLEGKAAVITLYVAHGLAADLLGRPLDWTQPLARVAHGLALVPMPGQPARPAKSTAPSAQTESKKTK